MRAAAVVDDLLGEELLRGIVASLLFDVVADQIDGCVGASAGRREGADTALTEFTGAEVEGQQTVRGCVGEEDFLSHRRKSTANGRDQAGLADATGEREDGKDRCTGFFLADRWRLSLLLTGLLEDTLERVPAGGDALARVLQCVGNRGLNGRELGDRFGRRLWRGRCVKPRRTGRIGLAGWPMRWEGRGFGGGFGLVAAIREALGLLIVEVVLSAAAAG